MPPSDEADARITRYAEAASVHGRASADGDRKRANAAHDVIAGIYRELRTEGTQERLLPLLSHGDAAVVTWAGAHALEFAPAEAERVLEQVARDGPVLFGFDAQQTLAVWREGKLSFP